MKNSVRFVLATLFLLLSAPAIADGGKGGCKATGSWYGYDESGSIWWISTVDRQSASHGTINLEIPGSANLFGAFAITELKGQWKRTSGNTFDWTVVGFSFDENIASHLIAKVRGTNVFDESCDKMMVTDIFMEVFLPTADIYSDPPIDTDDSFLDHPGFRIKVDMPELIP